MPGRALELALGTTGPRVSFEWWSRLGLEPATAGDTWSHPYGVLTAPGLAIGLHGAPIPTPMPTLVRADVAGLAPLLEERGVEVEDLRLGSEVFNELSFADPAGMRVRVLEARTFSPPASPGRPRIGRFLAASWPAADPEPVARFWERLHVQCEPVEDWALLRADLEGLRVAWHAPRVAAEPLLVFEAGPLPALRASLQALDLQPLVRGLGLARPHLVLRSPEGLKIALLA